MATDNIKYRFIQNVGDYFPAGYFSEDFINKVQKASGVSAEDMGKMCEPYIKLRGEYEKYKNYIINTHPRAKDAIRHTHDFNTRLLTVLGYDTSAPYDQFVTIDEDNHCVVPVRHVLTRNGQTTMFVMEMQHLIKTGEQEPAGLYEQQYNVEGAEQTVRHQQYYAGQWSEVFTLPDGCRISPAVINKAIDALFLLPVERRPRYILMMAGNTVFLLNGAADKWSRGAYLEFSLDELFVSAAIRAFRNHYALFHLLVCKDTLAGDSETVLMDTLVEDSYRNAYEVTKDLREGVVLAVETLANEALYYKRQVEHCPFGKLNAATGEYDVTDEDFETEVKDDCLTIVYRLLFVFYAESRTELDILPMGDDVYKQGYSLEMLRDMEQTRLNSEESRNGYFFDASIRHLFRLLFRGYNARDSQANNKSFRIRPIDSPLFDDSKLHHLADVRIRNCKWQEIICALSLSKKNGKRGRGRISYANLGVNQIGSVYESLLAFRGFYAEEDYIEVHKAGKPEEGSFLVPYRRMDDFQSDEISRDDEGIPVILPKGSFVYRLNGRDRQKSASYYTPEVLTRSTVKYTLKSIIDEVASGKRRATELLDLKILEPAMGAAAFQNEVINQLAEAYLTCQQQQLKRAGRQNWRISPDRYRDELQRVKSYIATHNVYGVDLNPTAIELGKLSLWLNVIHKDMETPFFANRLALGNAVIGAWLKVYSKDEVYGIKRGERQPLSPNEWWTKVPHKVKFFKNRVNRSVNEIYHFLLPDKNMLGVRNIREQKRANGVADAAMAQRLKDWTAAISWQEFATLQRLSEKIDVLLHEYYIDQLSIDRYTGNRDAVWDGSDSCKGKSMFENEEQAECYGKKQELFDTRYRHDNAYYKLKMVMDYWCSLWFWEYGDAASLPTREEYWGDIEALLDVDNDKLNESTSQAFEMVGEPSLFDNNSEPVRLSEEESEIVLKSKEELLTQSHDRLSLFADSGQPRLLIVRRLSRRYHFFHPMLEFIEVFWQRGGFDVICGNPPWIKLEFKEQGVVSEKFPEVAIRKLTAPAMRQMREKFSADESLRRLYEDEQTDVACSSAFLCAYANYPLLEGQQSNLYKCVLCNGMEMMSPQGYMGILCPESIYDDPKGQPLRRELYMRLRYHFQYENELRLFAEVDHHRKYGNQVLGPRRSSSPRFASIHNLFHPNTVDGCFAHDGSGTCGGIMDDDHRWNTAAHRDRIVWFGEEELRTLSQVFEDGADWHSAKLVSIQSREIVDVLEKFAKFPKHLSDCQTIISRCFDETNAVDDGIIKRETVKADVEHYKFIVKGPQFFVANPLYKTPRERCVLNSDYDNIDLSAIDDNYEGGTNFIPALGIPEYKSQIRGFQCGQEDGVPQYEDWVDYYKLAFRSMLSQAGERTLICAFLPRGSAHIDAVISVVFRKYKDSVEMAALCSSIVLDFYTKTIAANKLHPSRMQSFPIGVENKYQSALYLRILLLNCLTRRYAELWEAMWRDDYKLQTWSVDDSRLKPFATLTREWAWDVPLRNYFERRQALVEIDVLGAMALGLSLRDLETIYNIQFPVLRKYEQDTWYDTLGNIVFTRSTGLKGIGVDSATWNAIRHKAAGETYVHTIDPQKSELYGGRQVTYHAPFTRCDRIADYRRAWQHFEKELGGARETGNQIK